MQLHYDIPNLRHVCKERITIQDFEIAFDGTATIAPLWDPYQIDFCGSPLPAYDVEVSTQLCDEGVMPFAERQGRR